MLYVPISNYKGYFALVLRRRWRQNPISETTRANKETCIWAALSHPFHRHISAAQFFCFNSLTRVRSQNA